jgi:prolyl-tRNA editing enzyme YbaK/EbsC (Cys-tRNA(Pro) deacylase)
MDYHSVTRQIQELLSQHDCWYETFEHEAVRTSEEASRTRPGYRLKQGAKAIIVRVKTSDRDKRFLMLVFPADLRFDRRKAKQLLAVKDVRFATAEEVAEVTQGVEVGGVPPFGNVFRLEVVADPKLFENDRIVFNAGDRRFSVAMKSADYRRLVQPQVAELVEDDPHNESGCSC